MHKQYTIYVVSKRYINKQTAITMYFDYTLNYRNMCYVLTVSQHTETALLHTAEVWTDLSPT